MATLPPPASSPQPLTGRAGRNPLADHTNRRLLARILRENARERAPSYAIAVVAMAVVAATTAFSAWLIGDVVDEMVRGEDRDALIGIAGVVAATFVIKGIATFIQTDRLARVGNAIVASQQRRIFERVLQSDLTSLARYGGGDLVVRMTHNAAGVRQVIDLVVTAGARDLLTLLGLLAVMLVQQPVLTFVALIGAPLAIFGVNRLIKRVRSVAEREFVSLSEMTGTVQETVRGARVVKAFTLEATMRDRMSAAVGAVEGRSNRIARLNAATSPIMETVGGAAIALAILAGAYTMTGPNPATTPGELMSFVTALLLAYDPAKRLARLGLQMEKGLVGARLMYELIDATPAPGEDSDAPDLVVRDGRVRFEAVSQAYEPDVPALDALDLDLVPGTTTALVGPSGAGKSTAIAVLLRFFEPDGGRVTIDGTDINAVSLSSLRRAVAYVGQDTFLFAGSIADNIRLGRPGASDEDVRAAAEAAYVLEFTARLPLGLDTPVGEGGEGLSGGQRQRVAIARAVLKDAPIVALDEATSALDAHAEAAVQRALAALLKGRTALVVAHRLSTVRSADRIVVMERGRVRESGTHAELLERGEAYAALHELQFAA